MIEGKEIVSALGAAATESAEAARVGARILERGGNAMDAAAAAGLACCVLMPEMTDLGGYVCCALVLEGRSGRVWSVDANSVAPAAARPDMFEVMPVAPGTVSINANEYACSVRDDANLYGPLAVGVPGVLAGIGVLWERWGRLKWEEIVAPAQRLLDEGFPYGSIAAAIQFKAEVIRRFEPTVQHLMPEGRVPRPEDLWRRPGVEKTLARLASAGWRDFYEGELGRAIADYIIGAGGILTRADMAQFRPPVTEPLQTTYRQAAVYGANLPNGGLTSLQILNMLEAFDPLPDADVRYWHRFAEVLKLAWRDRLRYLGDPAFVEVPVARLLSKEYAAGRVETLRQFPEWVDRRPWPSPVTSGGTVHLSTADAAGNLVAATLSHGGLFGSCVTVPGTGIILGHGLCRFDPRPGRANSIAPGKRPLNNVAPMIVRRPDRDTATGLRGGRKIISVAAQLCQRMIDFGAAPREGATAPRIHVETQEPVELSDSLAPALREALARMGHEVRPLAEVAAAAHTVEVLKGESRIRAGGNTWAAGAGEAP